MMKMKKQKKTKKKDAVNENNLIKLFYYNMIKLLY